MVFRAAFCFGLRFSEAVTVDPARIIVEHDVPVLGRLGTGKRKKYGKRLEYRRALDDFGKEQASILSSYGRGLLGERLEVPLTNAFLNEVLDAIARHFGWVAPPGCKPKFTSHGFKGGRVLDYLWQGFSKDDVSEALLTSVDALGAYQAC